MRRNHAKEKLGRNEVVTIVSGMANADMVDFLGQFGFDGVFIDGEHGGVGWEQLGDISRACDLWGMMSLTRVNRNEPSLITRALDRGCNGIAVPHVNSRDDAERAVRAAKYAPRGGRGVFGGGRQSFGSSDYFLDANDQVLLAVILEEVAALENLDEMLEVPDIDVYVIGAGDLAQSMGHIDRFDHAEVREAVDRAVAKITATGRSVGLYDPVDVAASIEAGVRFLFVPWTNWVREGANGYLQAIASVTKAG